MSSYLLLVTALSIEAKAIRQIGVWKRVNVTLKGLFLYQLQDQPVLLVISGSGKVASAIATTLICQHYAPQIKVIINIGMAGQKEGPLGRMYWVNKITDHYSVKSWFPQLRNKSIDHKASLKTYETIQHQYDHLDLIDMEASGFIQAALKWVSIENIGVVKCISDTEQHHVSDVTKEKVFDLLLENKKTIQSVIKAYIPTEEAKLINQIDLELWLNQWHFTVTQQHQLKNILSNINLLKPGIVVNLKDQYQELKTSKQVIKQLQILHQQLSGTLYYE